MSAVDDPAAPPRERDARDRSDARYRFAGVALAALGVASGVGAALLDPGTEREVLVAFAGVGLYGAVLAYVVRPGATQDVDPAERVYDALAATGVALRDDLGLPDRAVYCPTDDDPDGFAPVYLVVPDREAADEATARRPVLGDRTGTDSVALYPTGGALFDAFEGLAVVDLETEPVELATQLAEAAVSGLGLAAAVEPTVEASDNRATVTVRAPRFGDATRFDHPVASFLAVGLAVGLDTTVTTSVTEVDEEGTEADAAETYRVVCEWTPRQTAGTTGSDGQR